MIERDLLAKALDYQESQISVLELELSIAKDCGTSPDRIRQIQTTIASLKENETAVIPLLDLSNVRDGDWGQLELSNVTPCLIVESGFYGEGRFRKGRVFFAGWGVESEIHVESGGQCSIIGGATVSFDEKKLLIVRRAFDPDELRSAIIADRAMKQRTTGLPDRTTEEKVECEKAASDHSENWLFFKQWCCSAVLVGFVALGQRYRLAARAARKNRSALFVGFSGVFLLFVGFRGLFWKSDEIPHPAKSQSDLVASHPTSIWSDVVSQPPKEQLIAIVETAVVRLDVETRTARAVGSGFVIDDSGIVVTNHHVVDGATSAKALFADDTSVRVIGVLATDTKRDIAFLQIQKPKTKPLTSLKLRKALPQKRQAVIAFGAPKGLSFTVSEGIISGPLRSAAELSELVADLADFSKTHNGEWIQTTTPLSHGNSGGPLVDLSGNVVGMNTRTIEGQNLNFAISAFDIAAVFEGVNSTKPTPFGAEPKPLSATSLLIEQLIGRWKSSTTGEVWLLGSYFEHLTIEVVESRVIKSGKGKLVYDGKGKSWSGSMSAIFSSDDSQRVRDTELKMVVLSHDEIEIIADVVKWNKKGQETSRKPTSMRFNRNR